MSMSQAVRVRAGAVWLLFVLGALLGCSSS